MMALQTAQHILNSDNNGNINDSSDALFDYAFCDSFNLGDFEPLPIASGSESNPSATDATIPPQKLGLEVPSITSSIKDESSCCSFSLKQQSRMINEELDVDIADPFYQRLRNIATVGDGVFSIGPSPLTIKPISTFSTTMPAFISPAPALVRSSSAESSTSSSSSAAAAPSSSSTSSVSRRTRKLQPGQWNDRFQDLLQFQKDHGHLYVPNNYQANPQLSQWVKRNRYQYKLKQSGKHSTLSDDREAALNAVGFVWDSHASFWHQRWNDLQAFWQRHGHCNVPNTYSDTSLSLWCKHQRRQYNRLRKGLGSTMTQERYQALQSLGFDWNPRNLKQG
jgi:Helicase associated domain